MNVRNLATPLELEAAKQPPQGKKLGSWSGPWLTEYSWQTAKAVQLGLEDPTQLGLKRGLLKAVDQTDQCNGSTDESAPPFCEREMDAETKRWLDKQAQKLLATTVGTTEEEPMSTTSVNLHSEPAQPVAESGSPRLTDAADAPVASPTPKWPRLASNGMCGAPAPRPARSNVTAATVEPEYSIGGTRA